MPHFAMRGLQCRFLPPGVTPNAANDEAILAGKSRCRYILPRTLENVTGDFPAMRPAGNALMMRYRLLPEIAHQLFTPNFYFYER